MSVSLVRKVVTKPHGTKEYSYLAVDTGAAPNATPPGPPLKVSGLTASCWPTPRWVQEALRVRFCFATYRDKKLVNGIAFCLAGYRLKPALALALHALLAINVIAFNQYQSAGAVRRERGDRQLRRIAN